MEMLVMLERYTYCASAKSCTNAIYRAKQNKKRKRSWTYTASWLLNAPEHIVRYLVAFPYFESVSTYTTSPFGTYGPRYYGIRKGSLATIVSLEEAICNGLPFGLLNAFSYPS